MSDPRATPDIDSTRVRFANLVIQSVSTSEPNPLGIASAVVTFSVDISWAGSWRAAPSRAEGKNWDAAWVFLKFLYQGQVAFDRAESKDLLSALDAADGDAVRASYAALVAKRTAPADQMENADALALLAPGGLRVEVKEPGLAWKLRYDARGDVPARTISVALRGDQVTFTVPLGWLHAKLRPGPTQPDPGVEVTASGDDLGVFVLRSAACPGGPGDVTFKDVTLVAELGAIGVRTGPGTLMLWPFGLQMVYVPEGAYSLGDPLGPSAAAHDCFYDPTAPARQQTYRVLSEQDPIPVSDEKEGPPALFYQSSSGVGDQKGPIPASFPKGYAAYYVMKRSITQGEYADFLNALSYRWAYGQMVRYSWAQGASRHSIYMAYGDPYTFVARQPDRACNFMEWTDGISFAAWAALRPMTELEFEKACRGPSPSPPTRQFAWGDDDARVASVTELIPGPAGAFVSANVNLDTYTITTGGVTEDFGPVVDAFRRYGALGGQALYGNVYAYQAVGSELVPYDLQGDRVSDGRSFYGVQGLSGNVWELCVTVANPKGRAFRGQHGGGTLNMWGQPPMVGDNGWPAGYEVPGTPLLEWPGVTGYGVSFRGGSWYTYASRGYVADRSYGSGAPGFFGRSHDIGFRCARTAPVPARTQA